MKGCDMKIRILIIFIINLLFLGVWLKPVFALEHTQKNGLFSMDIPEEWHWMEYPQEIIITYPDAKTMAMDIQLVPSRNLSPSDIKKAIKESDDKMIKEGIEAHHGVLIDDKEIKLDGVYAAQLDFKTALPNSIDVTYISFFNKGYAFTITYGSSDEKIHLGMDDAVATFKFR
jgi:hypothetical protein